MATKRNLVLEAGALAKCQKTDHTDHSRGGKSRCGHLISANSWMTTAAAIPIVSACNIWSKENREGCHKNESFQGSLPSPGDIITNREHSQ